MLKDDPIRAAEYFAVVENNNYLAHSIRTIESEFIRMGGVPYRIFTHVNPRIRGAITVFLKACCVINLPQVGEERKIRLELGHELGHIVFRFDDLIHACETKGGMASDDEEAFAWAFAYTLIMNKSDQHKDNKQIEKFIYSEGELKKELLETIRDKPQYVINKIKNILKIEENQ